MSWLLPTLNFASGMKNNENFERKENQS